MATRTDVIDAAIAVLKRGDGLTIDAVAREAGLTKPGVVHHVGSKEGLATSVVDRVLDCWDEDLRATLGDVDKPVNRVRAYLEFSFDHDFDASDLAVLADQKLREALASQWNERLEPWLGLDFEGTLEQRAAIRTIRLIADGAWINRSLGIRVWREGEDDAVRRQALSLLNGMSSE